MIFSTRRTFTGLSQGTALFAILTLSAISTSEMAQAACSSSGIGTYTCDGTNTSAITITGTDIAVTTGPEFSVIESSPNPALTLTGSGAISYIDDNASSLVSEGSYSLSIENDTSVSGLPASVFIQTNGISSGISIVSNSGAESTIVVNSSGVLTSGPDGSGALVVEAGAIGTADLTLNLNFISGEYGIQSSNHSQESSATTNITIAGDINVDGFGAYVNNTSNGPTSNLNISTKNITTTYDGLSLHNYNGSGSSTINAFVEGDINVLYGQAVSLYNGSYNGNSVINFSANNIYGLYSGININNNSQEGSANTYINISGDLVAESGRAFSLHSNSYLGDSNTVVRLNSVNSVYEGIYLYANSQNGSVSIDLDVSGDISSQYSSGLIVGGYAYQGDSTVKITTKNISSSYQGPMFSNYADNGSALSILSLGDILADQGQGATFQTSANEGNVTTVININNVTAGATGIQAYTNVNHGTATTNITLTGRLIAEQGYGVIVDSYTTNGNSIVAMDINSISSSLDAVRISNYGYDDLLGRSTIDVTANGELISTDSYGINIETNVADSYVTIAGKVHGGNGTAVGIHRLDGVERSATLELRPGYALEGATIAMVIDNSYVDTSLAAFDLPNTHLVLGGAGAASLDLARIDNSAGAILDGDANRISGFGTLTKTGSSIWTLTGSNTNSGNDNAFLSANINAGTLVLDGTTLALTTGIGAAPTSVSALAARMNAADIAANPSLVSTATGTLTIAPGASVSSIGASSINGDLVNAGGILLSDTYYNGNRSFPGDTLTITGKYVGNGGILALDTVLGGDDSPTDRLIIGGHASGRTLVKFNIVDGGGAQTHDGIMVVQALDGATTTANAFSLNNRVAAGLYEYSLHRGGEADSESWYLRSTFQLDPASPEVANYRAEVPLTSAIIPIATEYGYAMLGTLHERVGATWATPTVPAYEEQVVRDKNGRQTIVRVPSQATERSTWFPGAWGRLIGERGFRDNNNFERRGPDYDYTFTGIQTGLDIFAREETDGTLDKLGIYIGYGQIDASVKGAWQGRAGSIDMDAYTVGAYWTHKAAQGWYTDAIVQGTWYSADAKSIEGQRFKPNGFGVVASLEAGYAFNLGNGFTVEPQAQLAYQNVSFDNVADAYGRFNLADSESLRGRLGVRLAKTWNMAEAAKPRLITGWLRANVWHEFKGDTSNTVSSSLVYNPVALSSSLNGTWAEIGAGVSGQVSDNVSLFATGAYNRSVDNKGREAWNGKLGVTVKW